MGITNSVGWRNDIARGNAHLIYTAHGHVMTIRATKNRPGLSGDANSAPESGRAIAYSTMFAYTGRYEASEGSVTHHVDSAWNPNWVGTEQKHIFQIEGDPLIQRTLRISNGGADVFLELTWKPETG